MSTQAVLGTPLKVLERGGEWWRVQTPDGYTVASLCTDTCRRYAYLRPFAHSLGSGLDERASISLRLYRSCIYRADSAKAYY